MLPEGKVLRAIRNYSRWGGRGGGVIIIAIKPESSKQNQFELNFSRSTMSHIAPVIIREASKICIPEWEHLGQKPRSLHN